MVVERCPRFGFIVVVIAAYYRQRDTNSRQRAETEIMITREPRLKDLAHLERFRNEVKELAAESPMAVVEFYGTARHAVIQIEREIMQRQRELAILKRRPV